MTTDETGPLEEAVSEELDRRDDGSGLARLADAAEPFFTIGQVASLLDVPQATLRRLEDHDLVTPGRSEGGQRRYSRDDVDRIEQVRNLIQDGVTLPGVRKVLDLRQRITDLEHEIEHLRDERNAADDRVR
jgi:MerR family transcriptional regulator/heat shock protein HspR